MWKFSDDWHRLLRIVQHVEPQTLLTQARYDIARWFKRKRTVRDRLVIVPTALYIETSSICRGRCKSCYIPLHDRKKTHALSGEVLRQVVADAQTWGPNYICIVGGEPLDESIVETNLSLLRSAPGQRFLLCTGAHGRTDPLLMSQLGELGNTSVFFSIDGFKAVHDKIRGQGNFERTVRAMSAFSQHGKRLVGVSVTLRAENWKEVTSGAFLSFLASNHAYFVGFDPCFDAKETSEHRSDSYLHKAVRRLFEYGRDSSLVLFVNPFGRLHHEGFVPEHGWVAASVDYFGNVYGSRRGQVFGNVHEASLNSIVFGEAFQSGSQNLVVGGCTKDDPRREVFEDVLRAY